MPGRVPLCPRVEATEQGPGRGHPRVGWQKTVVGGRREPSSCAGNRGCGTATRFCHGPSLSLPVRRSMQVARGGRGAVSGSGPDRIARARAAH